jgi:starvation-inducible DNA-binding protein
MRVDVNFWSHRGRSAIHHLEPESPKRWARAAETEAQKVLEQDSEPPHRLREDIMARQKPKQPAMDIGIDSGDRKSIVQGLSELLADSYTLYLMTHNFHWNVTGPQFNSLHQMFMAQYTEQWTALDVIAERIRALGHPAPGTYREFAKLASIKEVEGVPSANDMVRQLVKAQEATARTARRLFPVVDGANDQPTADLLTQRLEVHEKTAWMLRSLLEE